jgi:GNAT superfamily N-acetyltransferase
MLRRAFRSLDRADVEAISRVHHRACLIAYRFMNWSYSLQEVEAWYSRKFAKWTWTLAAFEPDAGMAGFIALADRHVDQLYVDPSRQRSGIGSSLLDQALKISPGRARYMSSKKTNPLAPSMRDTAFKSAIDG